MAEKKFSGAPFGTQTARFDVTGVHPNKKVPGTFTQIPYDKPSTMELRNGSERQLSITSNEFQKRNGCLESTGSFSLANESVQGKVTAKHNKHKGVNNATLIMTTQPPAPVSDSHFTQSCQKSPSAPDQPKQCNHNNLNKEHVGDKQCQQLPKGKRKTYPARPYPNTVTDRKKVSCEKFLHLREAFEARKNATKKAPLGFSLKKELCLNQVKEIKTTTKCCSCMNCLHNERETFFMKNNTGPLKGGNGERDAFKTYQQTKRVPSLEEKICLCNKSENNNISNNSSKSQTNFNRNRGRSEDSQEYEGSNPGIDVELASEAGNAGIALEPILKLPKPSLSVNVSRGLSKSSFTRLVPAKSHILPFLNQQSVQAVTLEASRTNIARVVRFHTSKRSLTSVIDTSQKAEKTTGLSPNSTVQITPIKKVFKKEMHPSKIVDGASVSSTDKPPTGPKKSLESGSDGATSLASNEKRISLREHDVTSLASNEKRISLREHDVTSLASNEKRTSLREHDVASLASNEKRTSLREHDVASLASNEKRISLREQLQSLGKENCESLLRRKLGPGAYNTSIGGFSTKAVESKALGPGWARQLEVERLASLPHLLYKEQWEENKMLKRKLGPGSYDIKDFIQVANEKSRSGRGICDNLAPRFVEKAHLSSTPGPGTYGVGGVPQRALEDKDIQSTSTKGMLDKGDRKRTLPSVGSHLGPGTYRHKTCTDELLNKVTSLKGPYKLYSGDRNKPITEGYLAAPQLADLGPGQYEIGSFVDDLHSKERRTHGRFGKMSQYPDVPTERLFLFSQAHCNRRGVPGPGAYSVQELSKPAAVNSPGFLSSAKRDDKISQKFFTRNFNPVGAGRYDVQKFDEAQDINGHSSVFKSKTGKPNLQMAKFLQERIRSKDVSVENRVVLSQPCKMTRSITVM